MEWKIGYQTSATREKGYKLYEIVSYGSETDTLTHNELRHMSTGLSECIEGTKLW